MNKSEIIVTDLRCNIIKRIITDKSEYVRDLSMMEEEQFHEVCLKRGMSEEQFEDLIRNTVVEIPLAETEELLTKMIYKYCHKELYEIVIMFKESGKQITIDKSGEINEIEGVLISE